MTTGALKRAPSGEMVLTSTRAGRKLARMGNAIEHANHNPRYKSSGFRCLIDACQGVLLQAPDGVEFEIIGRLDDDPGLSAPEHRARELADRAALQAASNPDRWMTAKEAAAWLRKSRNFVYRHADELGARRVGLGRGSDLLFRVRDLETWLQQHSRVSSQLNSIVEHRR